MTTDQPQTDERKPTLAQIWDGINAAATTSEPPPVSDPIVDLGTAAPGRLARGRSGFAVMAGVIEDAMRTHTPRALGGRTGCLGCDWQDEVGGHPAHRADAVRADVLEVTGRVHAEHRPVGLDDCSCDDQDEGTYAEHLDAMVAAALAGEG